MTPTFFDLMGGIGGIRLGLERAGWKCMGYCENDKYSRRTYYANFGGADEFDWEDARTLPVDKIPDFDMLASGFPCQPWSTAGKREGFEDARGTLFFEIARLLQARRPPCFLLENVKGLLSEPMRPSFNRMMSILRVLGYAVSVRVLNSRDYGVPQNRERVFFAGFRTRSFEEAEFPWPAPNPKKASLTDILEPDPDPKYNLSEKLVKGLLGHLARNRLSGKGPGWGITLPESYWRGPGGAGHPGIVSPAVTGNYARGMTAVSMLRHSGQRGWEAKADGTSHALKGAGGGHSKVHIATQVVFDTVAVKTTNPHWKGDPREYHAGEEMRTLSRSQLAALRGMRIRRLTPRECFRLQGFPDSYRIDVCSDHQLYRQAGNTVSIPVVEAIGLAMLKRLQKA